MDSSSNGLGKLIPKSLGTKRRRTKASSIGSNDQEDGASSGRGRSIASQGTGESDGTSNHDSLRENNEGNELVSYGSDPES
jgi:hypothetical protein